MALVRGDWPARVAAPERHMPSRTLPYSSARSTDWCKHRDHLRAPGIGRGRRSPSALPTACLGAWPNTLRAMRQCLGFCIIMSAVIALQAGQAAADPPRCDLFGPRVDCGEWQIAADQSHSAARCQAPTAAAAAAASNNPSRTPPPHSWPAGYVGITQAQCEAKGCCWAPSEFEGAPHVDLPWCFTANADRSAGYRVTELREGPGACAADAPGIGVQQLLRAWHAHCVESSRTRWPPCPLSIRGPAHPACSQTGACLPAWS